MLAPFLKQLMFIKQFGIDEGRITLLGNEYEMLPAAVMSSIKIDEKKLKSEIKKIFKDLIEKTKNNGRGTRQNIKMLYDCLGMGKLEFLAVDNDKKKARVQVEGYKGNDEILKAVLSGIFSAGFEKEVRSGNIKDTKGKKEAVIG